MSDDAEPNAMAALMLVESLMLALMETGVIGQDEMAGAIDDVIATQRGMPEDGHNPAVVQAARREVYRIADRLVGTQPGRARP